MLNNFIDTHCHLNFKAFADNVGMIIDQAISDGISNIIVPGTDISSSHMAIKIANSYDSVFAAIGIHPHHIYQYHKNKKGDHIDSLKKDLVEISQLIDEPKVVAVGEVGIDRYYYRDTKYSTYEIDESFVELQKIALTRQIELAIAHKKSLILHNRLAKNDLLSTLNQNWDNQLRGKTVFHCCEPDEELLDFAIKHNVFVGVDGDVTFSKKKKQFVKKIPLKLLVLETDSPFLTPKPLRDNEDTKWPNAPSNITIIANYISRVLDMDVENLAKITTENAKNLFGIFK